MGDLLILNDFWLAITPLSLIQIRRGCLIVYVVDNLERVEAHLLVHLLALGALKLGHLVLQFLHRLELAISELPINVGSAGDYLKIVRQKQIVILTCRHFEETPTR